VDLPEETERRLRTAFKYGLTEKYFQREYQEVIEECESAIAELDALNAKQSPDKSE